MKPNDSKYFLWPEGVKVCSHLSQGHEKLTGLCRPGAIMAE